VSFKLPPPTIGWKGICKSKGDAMTVKLETTIQRFVGLSTDVKPTSPSVGSTFNELDTGYVYKYNGSVWVPANIIAVVEFVPYAYESLTVADTAIILTAAVYAQTDYAIKAFITLEDAQIRWRIDDVNPTASEGHLFEAGQNLMLESSDAVKQFRAIRTGASNGIIKVTYLRG